MKKGSLSGKQNVIGLKLGQELIETEAITEANSIWGRDGLQQPEELEMAAKPLELLLEGNLVLSTQLYVYS